MSDTDKQITFQEYVQDTLKSIHTGNPPPENLFEELANFSEWVSFLKNNQAEGISALIEGNSDQVVSALENLASYTNEYAPEYSPWTSTESIIMQKTSPSAEVHSPVPTKNAVPESFKNAIPSIKKSELERAKRREESVHRIMTNFNKESNLGWMKSLQEQLEQELTKPTISTSPDEIRTELQKRTREVLRLHGQEDKAPIFFEKVVADLPVQIANDREITRAMVKEIISYPSAPEQYPGGIIRSYSVVKAKSPQELERKLKEVTQHVRVETAAQLVPHRRSEPAIIEQKVIETYSNIPMTRPSIVKVIAAATNTKEADVEKGMNSRSQARYVRTSVRHAMQNSPDGSIKSVLENIPKDRSTPDIESYKTSVTSLSIDPTLDHFIGTMYVKNSQHLMDHGASIADILHLMAEDRLHRSSKGSGLLGGLKAIFTRNLLGKLPIPGARLASLGDFVLDRIGTGITALLTKGFSLNLSNLPESLENKNIWPILGFVGVVLLASAFGHIVLPEVDRLAFSDIGTGGAGVGDGPVVDCNDPATKASNPACTFTACVGDCRWPTSGYITQGPASSCGSHSDGSDSNGVDIATEGTGVEVFSVLNGTVESVYNGCEDYKGDVVSPGKDCGGGYGNNIIITGVSPSDGKSYRIIYGHLQSALNVKAGDRVFAGAGHPAIGKMDHTGYTTGQHLHFGVLSGGNVLDILPNNDPFPISSLEGCNSNSSCAEDCPFDFVSP